MDQRDFVESLYPHDLQPDEELKKLKDGDKVTNPKWLKRDFEEPMELYNGCAQTPGPTCPPIHQ